MSKNRGFGVGAVVVIVALILIIGGYMYYKRDAATTPDTTEVNVDSTPVDTDNAGAVGGILEDGTATDTATSTAN